MEKKKSGVNLQLIKTTELLWRGNNPTMTEARDMVKGYRFNVLILNRFSVSFIS